MYIYLIVLLMLVLKTFLYRVCTGHGKPGKSWNFRISFSRPGKSWSLSLGHGVVENDVY